MSAPIELDEDRRSALEKVARRRKVSFRRVLERAVDEFIRRTDDEELLESSAQVARRTGLMEKDAVRIVREWRSRNKARRD